MSAIEIHKQFRLAGIRLSNLLREEGGVYPSQFIWNKALKFHLDLDKLCCDNDGYFEPHINFHESGTIYSTWKEDLFYMIIEFHLDGTITYDVENEWGNWEGIIEDVERVGNFFPQKEKKQWEQQ